MSDMPDWLPEPLKLGAWSTQTYDHLYEWFQNEILSAPLEYDSQEVWYFREKEDGYEKLFWHLTSREDTATKERFPDLPRCTRLPWLRPVLRNASKPEVLHWDHVEGDGTTKTYVWLEAYDYVVILKKFDNGSRRLITAYWIEYANEKNKLLKKYERRTHP